jgi:hypothetical protein
MKRATGSTDEPDNQPGLSLSPLYFSSTHPEAKKRQIVVSSTI